ncbi:30S ribosomal protein S3 [Candidatus Collierbacteria bacterium]|nr:30S ribosomal protein S3 [Candidatus Collierbacteria bacterium]
MGQKVHPTGFRLGPLYTWASQWYAEKGNYQEQIFEDQSLRLFLTKRLTLAGITKIEIKRSINTINIILHVARPGVVIGRGGSTLKALQDELEGMIEVSKSGNKGKRIGLDVVEVENAEQEAAIVAQRIADQLVKRYPSRRAVSQALDKVRQAGALGIKIQLSGRINGAEISRREKYSSGTVPTQTLRNDISYAQVPALTRSGYVGVKVWINRGEKIIIS